LEPSGGIPVGKAKSFIVPAGINMNAPMMRSTLSRYGPQDDHFTARFLFFVSFATIHPPIVIGSGAANYRVFTIK
jgi:hypothetical protein